MHTHTFTFFYIHLFIPATVSTILSASLSIRVGLPVLKFMHTSTNI
jgi:hypothetical protein